MILSSENKLLEIVQEIGPTICQYAAEAERERQLAKPVLNAMIDAGLFRLLTPHSLGGLEMDPITSARVIEEVAGFDSAAGWALMTGNSADWWCSRLPEGGPEEIYADNPSTIIAAAFHPPQHATPVEGGYRVTGRGPLASNIHDATWLMMTALVMDGTQPKMTNGAPEAISVILRAQEAEIIDTWYALGMRGTDSNDVAVSEVFVPASRTFPLVPEFEPGPHYQGPLYRLPGMGEVAVFMSPMCLAIAQGAVTELRELAQSKTPFGSTTPLRERAAVQTKVARANAILRSARLLFYETLSEAWERTLAGRTSTLAQKADLLLAAAYAVSNSVQVVELMYSVAGTSAIYTRGRLERHFRDIHVLRHHGFTSESRYETVGQVYLGVPPEFGLVAF